MDLNDSELASDVGEAVMAVEVNADIIYFVSAESDDEDSPSPLTNTYAHDIPNSWLDPCAQAELVDVDDPNAALNIECKNIDWNNVDVINGMLPLELENAKDIPKDCRGSTVLLSLEIMFIKMMEKEYDVKIPFNKMTMEYDDGNPSRGIPARVVFGVPNRIKNLVFRTLQSKDPTVRLMHKGHQWNFKPKVPPQLVPCHNLENTHALPLLPT